MQSTMVKRQGNWALGTKWTPQCKSVHACDLESAESEHDKEAGHSIDWASIESASRLTCESLEKICAGRAPSTGKEWSYITRTSEPARRLENNLLSCEKLEAINIHSRRLAINRDQGSYLPPLYGSILKSEAVNNRKRLWWGIQIGSFVPA